MDHRFCIAPMMDWTDRHCRYFMRLLTRQARLYTEMVHTGALLHGDPRRFLCHNPLERPLALQLGGSDPAALARGSELAQDAGYSEVNLNVGCPSDRVRSGSFGACLMARPALVADCVRAMRDAVEIPVTVKCRIGIDALDSDGALADFVGTVAGAGCRCFIIHARIALLQGLSPKENREVPPLNYPRVYRIKESFPDLEIVLNGGIRDVNQAAGQLDRVDGVMMGREAYQNPYSLTEVDRILFGCEDSPLTRHEVIEHFIPYVARELDRGVPLQQITRHVLGLFQGLPGARKFRRFISENAHAPGADTDTLRHAAELVRAGSEARA